MNLFDYIKKIYQNLFFQFRFKRFGRYSYIKSFENLKNTKNISIGPHVFIKSDARLESLGGEIVIGDGCQFEKGISITSAKHVKIGSGVLVARNVYISDHSHNIDNIEISPVLSGINNINPVVIGDNCWIGTNVVILPGTKIGRGSVIGANSVLRGVYPDAVMLVGCPAKIVKKYDSKSMTWEKLVYSGKMQTS